MRASGRLAGRGDAHVQEKLGEYAWNLGMAFQLVDDVLDFTAREKTLGKPVGGDLREGKVTLPLVTPWNAPRPRSANWWRPSCGSGTTRGAVRAASWPCSRSTAASSA